MDIDANKALARRMLGLWASGAHEDPRSILDEDYVNHQEPFVADGSSDLDLTRWIALLQIHRAAFPDGAVEILMQIAEDDRVATRFRFSGTNTGPYLGKPATGRRAAWTGIEIDVIRDGRIVESWVDWDFYRQLKELGHIG